MKKDLAGVCLNIFVVDSVINWGPVCNPTLCHVIAGMDLCRLNRKWMDVLSKSSESQAKKKNTIINRAVRNSNSF